MLINVHFFARQLQALESMDHLEILVSQHQNIRNMLHSAEAIKVVAERTRILEQIRSELELHIYLEEAHVYPVLENFDSMKRRVFGFWREHEGIRVALQNVLSVQQAEQMFHARMSTLVEMFEEHVRDEERHIFPEARRLLSADQLEKMERNLKDTISERGIAA